MQFSKLLFQKLTKLWRFFLIYWPRSLRRLGFVKECWSLELRQWVGIPYLISYQKPSLILHVLLPRKRRIVRCRLCKLQHLNSFFWRLYQLYMRWLFLELDRLVPFWHVQMYQFLQMRPLLIKLYYLRLMLQQLIIFPFLFLKILKFCIFKFFRVFASN